MKKTTKMFAVLLALVLCVSTVPVCAEEQIAEPPGIDEWTLSTTLSVFVSSPVPREFSPADFPEADCRSVTVIGRRVFEDSVKYELMLSFENAEKRDLAEKALEKNSLITEFAQGVHFDKFVVVELSKSSCNLPLGASIDIGRKYLRIYGDGATADWSIIFEVDPQIIDDSENPREVFDEFGISGYEPLKYLGPDGIVSGASAWNTPSPVHAYEIQIRQLEKPYFGLITRLLSTPGFKSVFIRTETVTPSLIISREKWSLDNPELASLTLSGGRQTKPRFPGDEIYTIDQTATVKARSLGTVTLRYSYSFDDAAAECTINIFQPKYDVNLDNKVTTSDALLVLQCAVGKISMSDDMKTLTDIDLDGSTTTSDALFTLLAAVGKIPSGQ